MRIFCISPLFVPHADSEAFCGAKMVQALLDMGIDIKVVAYPLQTAAGKCDLSPCWRQLDEKVVTSIVPDTGLVNAVKAVMKYRIYGYSRWINPVLAYAEACHKEQPFDIVYSRSLPMIAQIAGYFVSRKLKLPWVANINDPWDWPNQITNHMSSFERTLSDYWLRKTLQTADLLTFPNRRLCNYHLNLAKTNKPTAVIPHIGYHAGKKQNDGEIFQIVHAGKLGSHEALERPTSALLNGLRRFLQLRPEAGSHTRLVLVGQKDDNTESFIKERELTGIVTSTGKVSYEESIDHIDSASVCLLIEGKISEGIFLPSKLADYVVAKKPVLAISPAVGVVADLEPANWLLRVDQDNEEDVTTALASYYDDFTHGRLAFRTPPEHVIHQYQPQVVAERLLSTIATI